VSYELELRGITKRFPGVLANDQVDLAVRTGEIHAVVGENGAGKTTLMSILYGLMPPDEGEILLRGEPVHFHSALDAIEAGLGMVHQAFRLFPTLTVAENVVFRAEPSRFGFVDRRRAVAEVGRLAEEYGLAVDPTATVEELPVGVLQRVEILKALYRQARVLILDEPTAVLTPQERESLFTVMRRLRERGHTIVFITHKLGEVMAVGDRVTVLRNGRTVAHLDAAATHPAEISRLMTGRDVELMTRSGPVDPGEVVLDVSGLSVKGAHDLTVVDGVGFRLRAGEIVGIAGVAGNGQNELIEAIAGLTPVEQGSVGLGGVDITTASVARRREAGLAYIPEDRHRVGTAAPGELWANLVMGRQHDPEFSRGVWLRPERIGEHVEQMIAEFDIRVPAHDTAVETLSGGNLQKVVVARELGGDATVLIAEQPTRGVDIGATEFIHRRLMEFRDRGGAVLLVSAELGELLALANRILVMYEGRVVAELESSATDEAELGLAMTGMLAHG
jgi:simple sugar transport system ATP-binding protein